MVENRGVAIAQKEDEEIPAGTENLPGMEDKHFCRIIYTDLVFKLYRMMTLVFFNFVIQLTSIMIYLYNFLEPWTDDMTTKKNICRVVILMPMTMAQSAFLLYIFHYLPYVIDTLMYKGLVRDIAVQFCYMVEILFVCNAFFYLGVLHEILVHYSFLFEIFSPRTFSFCSF